MHIFLTPDAQIGAQALQARLVGELTAGKSVLWMMPGGSNIPVCVSIMQSLPAELTHNLTLALTDERYGPVGHKDSNWQQLDELGFDNKNATRVDTLLGHELADTVQTYNDKLVVIMAAAEVIIGQYGMGADGHIAGILPSSPAVEADGLVTGYDAGKFQRITTTFRAIEKCNVAFLLAFGDDKRQAFENLQQDLTLAEQPAQILKKLPEAYVYNDQIGDTV